MKLYRVMKADADGKPLVGTRRNMLGVRPTDPAITDPTRSFDVAAVTDADPVVPGEGLSTFLVPGRLRVKRDEAEFVLDTAAVAGRLTANPDRPPHCPLGPRAAMTLAEFQHALADTRDAWERVG